MAELHFYRGKRLLHLSLGGLKLTFCHRLTEPLMEESAPTETEELLCPHCWSAFEQRAGEGQAMCVFKEVD